jgi:hypothetical protein
MKKASVYGMVNSFDYNLFHAINDLAGTQVFWNPVMKFLAQDGEYLFYLASIGFCVRA